MEKLAYLTAYVKGDGTNPNLAAGIAAQLTLLSLAMPIGPSELGVDLANAILIGAAFPGPISISTSEDGSTSVQITVPGLTGTPGAEFVAPPLLAGGLVVPADQVLVLSPPPLITVV